MAHEARSFARLMYPQVFGKYVLERELARGGMARVVLATLRGASGFEKKLVVKQIRDELAFDSEFVRRFVEEAKTTVALSHPNIVPVYELGVEQGTYFLAMELVEGISVAELLKYDSQNAGKRVGLSPEEGAYIGAEICRALEYAHRRMKVVHRDITPRNVMIDEEGEVKIIDFGIAAPALVTGHEVFGSPGHMPPEQIDGKELGPPTDVFAAAVVLMEAWSGHPPFRRATPEECDAAMRGPHPKPSEVDIRLLPLDEPILRAMSLDPAKRQQEAGELGRPLRAFLQGVDVTDVSRALGERVRRARREEPPTPAQRDATQRRPSQASYGEIGTKTFAAREEVKQWSDRPSSNMPSTRKMEEAVEPPSTRRLDSGKPPPPKDSARPPKLERPPTPAPMLLAAEKAALRAALEALEREKEKRESEPEPAPESTRPSSETMATQPLEAPVRKPASPSAPPEANAKPRWPLFVLAAGGLALAAVWYVRTQSQQQTPGPSPTVTVSSSTSKPPSSVATAPSSAAPIASVSAPPSATVSSPPSVALTATTPPVGTSAGTSTTTASAPSAAATGRVTLALFGDPGTRVSVDGAPRGLCPTRAVVEPGQHDVRFNFEPTGESRGERITVRAGENVTLRADFTGATPTVRVQRQ